MIELTNLAWGEPKSIITSRGPTILKEATPNDGFWRVWREHKEDLKAAGVTVSCFKQVLKVVWWERDGAFQMPTIKPMEVETFTLPDLEPLQDSSILLPYQVPLVQQLTRAMKQFGSSLNGCGTGLGKTYMTLGVARELGLKPLVICPKPIVDDWKEAAQKMNVELVGVHGWEWMKTGKTPFLKWIMKRVKKKVDDGYVLVDKKDRLEWDIPNDVALVFDECHRAANDGTQNSKMVQDAVQTRRPIMALSATIADNPMKMRAVGYMLSLHRNGSDYFEWLKKYGVVKTRFGLEFQGTARHLQAIHAQIFPHKGIRVRAEQLGKAFPETQIIAKSYNTEEAGEIQSVYMEMLARCKELEELGSSTACILVEILRARQQVELLKVPLMISLARDFLEEGNSVFLAVNFRDTLKELIKHLEIKSVIAGGQKPEHRKEAIQAFQADKNHVIAGILKACREGISLHDLHGNRPRAALIMPSPSSFDIKQTFGRVWRAGGKTPSIQRVLFAKDTIEEDVCRRLAEKLDSLDLLMDGDLQKGIFPASYSTMRPKDDKEDDEMDAV